MQVIRNTRNNHLTALKGDRPDILLNNERELLNQVSAALTVIHGGQFRDSRKINYSVSPVK